MVWTACCDRFERSQSKKTMNDVGAATGGGGGGGGGGSEEQAATSSVVARTTNSFLSMICSLKAEASEGRSSLSDRALARAFGIKRHNPARVPAPCRKDCAGRYLQCLFRQRAYRAPPRCRAGCASSARG